MSFIKKYYPMVISILFMVIYSLFIGAVLFENVYILENDFQLMELLVVMTFLIVAALWAEIIGFMIHAAKNHNVIWCLWIYIFNAFIIPYYNLKYVVKSEKNKVPMIVFICLLICSLIIGLGLCIIYK